MTSLATLTAEGLTKRFSAAPLFAPLSFSLHSGEIVAITGANGSGKSTLLKMLARVLTPSKGGVTYQIDGKEYSIEEHQPYIGFAAPYLELYSELTAIEHLQFVAELKSKRIGAKESLSILTSLGLDGSVAESDLHVKQYSSGMQQRVKLAMAFALEPNFIFLDEPGSNLDSDGIEKLFAKIKSVASGGALVVIATNDPAETMLASKVIALEPYQRSAP
ncbi:MAG TPA: ABC transporter ATP-binding protein [Candidatus Kapabacteria bacterium]|nr:ABC transporter ATP-binding protein [Candidatus Kapabacteria bacterium]